MIFTHLKCYTPIDVHIIKVHYVKKMIKKINGPKKGKMYYFSQCSYYVLRKHLVKNYPDMCFNNLIKFNASHHYYITHVL